MQPTPINFQPDNLGDDLVKLLPLEAANYDGLYAVAADPLLWEQHPASDRYKPEVFRSFFDAAIDSGTAFLIVEATTNMIIGTTRFYDYIPQTSSIAIGYTFLMRECWGGGYNMAVKKNLLNYIFNFIDNVYFHVGSQNFRSQIAVKRLGATKVREYNSETNGIPFISFEYLLIKNNWI
ncbi:MAG: hypothetical protein RIS47_51 [Bacteroidota bacterium]